MESRTFTCRRTIALIGVCLLLVTRPVTAVDVFLIPNSATDNVMAFDVVDGTLVDAAFIPTDNTVVSALESLVKVCEGAKLPLFAADVVLSIASAPSLFRHLRKRWFDLAAFVPIVIALLAGGTGITLVILRQAVIPQMGLDDAQQDETSIETQSPIVELVQTGGVF